MGCFSVLLAIRRPCSTRTWFLASFVTSDPCFEAIVSAPTQRLAELPLLSRIERQEILGEWQECQGFATTSACVHEMFERQTESAPDAPGIVFDGGRLTYRELSVRSNQLANFLRRLGVEPETRVGLCMNHSPDLIVAILAVLKSGGAFVPLDPAYPKQRLSFLVDDARLKIILTQETLGFLLRRPCDRSRESRSNKPASNCGFGSRLEEDRERKS